MPASASDGTTSTPCTCSCDGDHVRPDHTPALSESGLDDASGLVDAGLDGSMANDIAVCGFSLKFPQEATSPDAFWEMILKKRCAMTDFPADRFNGEGFYRENSGSNTLPLRGGHFFQEDPALFDADFFSISPAEAASMDPMQRWLMEAAYRALENAGMSMESVSGSLTGVYAGSFSVDYMLQLARDAECPPKYAAVGFGLSMLANRLSWFYNLHGPSIALDSACSATAMATDIACQALRNGSCDMAMVAGSNMATAPEGYVWMSNINFLSPDSKCQSFDHRGNGYARGEGLAVVILKRLSDAVRDGNTIRAVIRATGSNEDGRTPGITQPSREAQERIIRRAYKQAGLSMAHTRFIEAHGTGTAIGDPREAQAIGSAFREHRSPDDPLYVGAVKSNIGHLEGASGLAGLIKAVLVLEKGIIPPNTNFEKLNPKIDAEFLRLKFPQEAQVWPTDGLRRASVSSFGFGGANSHIVLDDAYNYLRLRSLSARHCTTVLPSLSDSDEELRSLMTRNIEGRVAVPKLLVWSTSDKEGISRIVDVFSDWERKNIDPQNFGEMLPNLAFTLDSHRSRLQWRSWAVIGSSTQLSDLRNHISAPVRCPTRPPRLGFVFSGQGAQWFAMGRELVNAVPSFRAEIYRAGNYLRSLGCPWSVLDELNKDKDASRVDEAELSQPLCTILQVALVNLLRKCGVKPAAVVGHSSGEIAAAYAGGYLTKESAWRLAYFRGLCSADLAAQSGTEEAPPTLPRGAMMSVGLPEAQARELVESLNSSAIGYGITIACINSPSNVTISGEETLIDKLQARLNASKVFARKLRVPLAYHSRQMEIISSQYVSMVGELSSPEREKHELEDLVPMISSVTSERIEASRLTDATYWALNLVSPVQFSLALSTLCKNSHADLVKKLDLSHRLITVVDHLVEIGPHAALQGPIRETLRTVTTLQGESRTIGYSSVLRRGESAVDCALKMLGELHCLGVPVELRVVNELDQHHDSELDADECKDVMQYHRSMLTNLPEYPFDHSRQFWHEGRLSRNYRLRRHPPSELLGVRDRNWDGADARWQHFIRFSEMPWAEQHVINGTILYPGTGMLAMAVEGARQLAGEEEGSPMVDGYSLWDVRFEGAMALQPGSMGTEVQTSIRRIGKKGEHRSPTFEFTIRTPPQDEGEWTVNCRGFVSVSLERPTNSDGPDDWERERTLAFRQGAAERLSTLLNTQGSPVDSSKMYRFLKNHGYDYGTDFQLAHNQNFHKAEKGVTADVNLLGSRDKTETFVFHPASLDAILHLCFTAFSSGGTTAMATAIPSHISRMWISSQGVSGAGQKRVTACSVITENLKRGFSTSGGAFHKTSADGDAPVLDVWYEGLELTNVTRPISTELSLPNPRQWYMNVDCKVDVGKLSHNQVVAMLGELHHPDEDLSLFYQDLENLVQLSLRSLDQVVKDDPSLLSSLDGTLWKSRYWAWTQHRLGLGSDGKAADQDVLGDLVSRLGAFNEVGRLYAHVSDNLPAILKGEIDPLELLVDSGLLKGYYKELAGYRCSKQIASYVDLLAHQTPGLTILEVGGGTGSATRTLTVALGPRGPDNTADRQSGSLRCQRYHFTDISAAFSEKAQEEFAAFQRQMTFGTLNIEKDPLAQGFEESSYDIVVADNVLHATTDLKETLQNLRRVMKPGAKLLMHEPLKHLAGLLGFVFGLFPGWWLAGTAAGQDGGAPLLAPTLTAEAWDGLLKETGFSGADMVFKDFDDSVAHHLGWLVATAVDLEDEKCPLSITPRPDGGVATIAINTENEAQVELSGKLSSSLGSHLGLETRVVSLDEAAQDVEDAKNWNLVILLVDYGDPFLRTCDGPAWSRLKRIIQTSRHLLWVSSNGGDPQTQSPDQGLLEGMARSLRAEYYNLHLVTLALSPPSLDKDRQDHNPVTHIVQVASEMAFRPAHQPYEQEYVEVDDKLATRRLVEAAELRSAVDASLVPYAVVRTPLDGQVPFELSTLPLEDDPSGIPFFVPSAPHSLSDEDKAGPVVPVIIRAAMLRSQNRATSLGLDEDLGISYFCSGIVASSDTEILSQFRPGDRVMALVRGPLGSPKYVSARHLARIPDEVAFADACAGACHLMTAYHSLVSVSHINAADKVLIRNGAASSIAMAALRLLLSSSGNRQQVPSPLAAYRSHIYTTAANQQERDWLVMNLHINADNVLPEAWFDGRSRMNPMVAAQWGTKFNVVLDTCREDHHDTVISNSSCGNHPGETLADYLARGSRCVRLVCSDNGEGRPQSLHHTTGSSWPRNVSVTTISVAEVCDMEIAHDSQVSLCYAAANAGSLILDHSSSPMSGKEPLRRYSASDIAGAFAQLAQSDRETVIVEFSEDDTVELRVPKEPPYDVDPNATYLLAGGIGGIGRFMATWLVNRGARFLVLLSRSGPRTDKVWKYLEDLGNRGVHVEAPSCDISDEQQLKLLLDNRATRGLPPVKGCIQCVMVMEELILEKMEFAEWKSVTTPKVQGSWNLYQQLCEAPGTPSLDFFIFVSSMMGTIGGGSLSAYSGANSYMDALARHMASRGHNAASIALGIVPDAGWLTEHTERLDSLDQTQRYAHTQLLEIEALLHTYCNPGRPAWSHTRVGCHTVTGVRPPAHWGHAEEVPFNFTQPLWGHMHHIPPLLIDGDDTSQVETQWAQNQKALDAAARIATAESPAEAAEIASDALAERIAALLGTPVDRFEAQKPMHTYGIDSLSAIEIRNWVAKVFDADLPVFDILGGATLESAGIAIARKVYSARS